jgi:serine/threonine-protein kinase RsbW
MLLQMEEVGEFALALPARSEHLGTVRRAVCEFAASMGLDEPTIADLRLAVNEACSNVVRHAYDEDAGPMRVEARPVGDYLVVVVHDDGRGLSKASSDPGTGLGLRVASAVSNSFEVRQKSAGTEVRLAFLLANPA